MPFLRTVGFLCLMLVASVSGATTPAPKDVIDRLHAALIGTMKRAQELGLDGRYAALQPVLLECFDFERMIAAASGSHWTGASEDERRRLLQAFTHLSITTYAVRFNGYSGESFETLGERSGPRETILIDTRLNRADGPPVPITYVLAERNGSWRIVDILLDRSISELAVRRSEYNQVLRNGGPGALAANLDEKAEELRRE